MTISAHRDIAVMDLLQLLLALVMQLLNLLGQRSLGMCMLQLLLLDKEVDAVHSTGKRSLGCLAPEQQLQCSAHKEEASGL